MKKNPLKIAFSTQKGGVGKTTFTVLAASYLQYLKNYNVVVVDCDFPQHSIKMMRQRDIDMVGKDEFYKTQFVQQCKTLDKKAYPVITASSDNAVDNALAFLENNETEVDVLFFDLPGTVNSNGVLKSIASMDYIFTPIIADRVVMESSLSFASVVQGNMVDKMGNLKGLHLFWNQVDGREKTELYELYEKVMKELDLKLLQTFIPNTTRYKKELSQERHNVFRSTFFPADKRLLVGSNLDKLMEEICSTINL